MQDILHSLLAILRAMRRYRWIVLVTAMIVILLGWTSVYHLNDYYVAKARIFVDSNRVLKPLLKGIVVQPDVNERVSLMSRTFLSRPNLEKLVRMTDLDVEAVTPLEKELVISGLGNTIRLRGTRGNSSLYTISYTNKDPALAKRMVQSLITVFVESTLGDNRQDSESAQDFLKLQIADYEKRLAAADRRLSDFKRENSGKMPSEAGTYYQRLETVKTNTRNASIELREAQSQRISLQQQLDREPRTIIESVPGTGVVSILDTQIQEQRRELSSLLALYTERHPRIGQLRDSIAALESQKLNAPASDSSSGTVFNRVLNPARQEIARLLAEAEGRVAALNVRVDAYEQQVVELSEVIESIPKVEATLKRLDRDYNVVKSQYEQILERRESARLSEQVEQNVDDVKFRVIDPPFVPLKPSGPKKSEYTVATLLAGFGLGAGLAFLLSLLFPVFYDAEAIANKTGASVLGTVGLQTRRLTKVREGLSWLVYFALVMLIVLVCAVLLAYYQGVINDSHINRIMNSPIGSYMTGLERISAGLYEGIQKTVLQKFQ